MSDDELALFSIAVETPSAPQEMRIRPEQVTKIREAFRVAGIADPSKQKDLVYSCVVRHVSSLDDLLARDVRPILKRISERAQMLPSTTGNSWDNRDHDTWIDKL